MSFRRTATLALAAAALVSGCKEVTQEPPPQEIVVAAFSSPACSDPSALDPLKCSQTAVPTPNDLALAAVPKLPGSAQKALLQAFVDAGGFPSDQAVGITIPIKRLTFDAASGKYVLATYAQSPLVNQATLTTAGANRTVVVLKIDGASPTEQPIEVDAANCTTGQIALQRAADPARGGSRAWPTGRYVFAMRAGAVRTTTGTLISADQAISLVAPNKDLSNPNNQPPGGLDPSLVATIEPVRASLWQPISWNSSTPGTPGGAWAPTGASPISAFAAVAPYIPPDQVAVIATFEVASGAQAIPGLPMPTAPVDAASGIAPLPLDLLRTGPPASSGANTIAYNPAFKSAAKGLTTLDGFSTTGTVFAPVTVPIDAGTVTAATVSLWKIPSTGPAVLLKEFRNELATGGPTAAAAADYLAQPDPLNIASGVNITPTAPCRIQAGCSPAVAFQAGVPVPVSPTASFYLPPLEEATDYAVVITTGVKDIAGRPLQKSTVARILVDPGFDLLVHPVSKKSLLAGIDDATAAALQKMRGQLAPVLTAAGLTSNDVALAYTFRTQSVTGTSLQLAAAPYGTEKTATAALFVPLAASTTIPAGSYADVADFYDVTFPSVDATDKTTGALNPSQAAWSQVALKALVAAPSAANPNLVACPAPADAFKCAPLVVFGHGLHGKRGDMLAVAESLAAKGFVVAAIDFPQHGDRTWCYVASDCDNGGVDGTCTPFPGGLGQGDVDPAGAPISPGTCTVGVPKATKSGQTFISGNFFRTRDALRQNLLDQAALVLALARPPSAAWPFQPSPTDPFTAMLAATGVVVDPSQVYWEGISLGGIAGTEVLATSSRYSRGVTSVAGGTLVDVFTHAPAFQPQVNALFTGLLKEELDAIAPGTPFTPALVDGTSASFNLGVASAYLKTTVLAKWILDPGDPLNFASHLRTSPLPDLLSPTLAPQSPKDVLGQVAVGDIVIPNPFNRELFTVGQIDVVEYTSLGAYLSPNNIMHGILSFDPTAQAQAATYLFDVTKPPAPPTQVTVP